MPTTSITAPPHVLAAGAVTVKQFSFFQALDADVPVGEEILA